MTVDQREHFCSFSLCYRFGLSFVIRIFSNFSVNEADMSSLNNNSLCMLQPGLAPPRATVSSLAASQDDLEAVNLPPLRTSPTPSPPAHPPSLPIYLSLLKSSSFMHSNPRPLDRQSHAVGHAMKCSRIVPS